MPLPLKRAGLICVFGVFAASEIAEAATPPGGTLSLTSGPVAWNGFPGPGVSPNESTCVDGTNCDTFTVTVAPGDYTGKRARFSVTWTNQFNDYDVDVHSGSNSGPVVGSSGGGAPETKEESTWDINAVLAVATTYTVHAVYFAVGAGDPYHGVVTLEPIPIGAPRIANYISGTKIGLAFSRNKTVYAHGAQRDLEPSARVDFQGNAYAASIRGLTAGDDLWRFDLNPASPTYDPFLRAAGVLFDSSSNITSNPSYKGQPDAQVQRSGLAGGDGGGDMDLAVAFRASSSPLIPSTGFPTLALTSLVAANISAQRSTDRAETYTANPAGNLPVIGEDDRNWMEFFGGNVVYLGYREFAGLQVDAHFYVNRSDDGGLTYEPAMLAAQGGNTTGPVTVDQRDGTVYFCYQGPSPNGNQLRVAIGRPDPVTGHPVFDPLNPTIAATGVSPTIAALFPVCKVAPDGTVYVAYSDGGSAIYLAHSLDQGRTWATPVRVSNLSSPSTSLFPWLTTGKLPGSVALAWYGVQASDSDDGKGANNDAANWKVFFAESTNATASSPSFYQGVASDHYVHGANISLGGFGGTANRNLGDFFQLATDPQGLAFIAFDDDSNDFTGNTGVTHQTGGISLTTGNVMKISGKDPAPAFNSSAPQVIDERHDARVNADAPTVPNVDTPVDILSIQYGCEISSGKTLLTSKMLLSGLTTVPPQGIWRANFASNPSRPGVSDHADQWFVQASTDETGASTFTYGTALRNGDGSITYTPAGSPDFGAIDTSASSVTWKVDIAKLNALQKRGLIGSGANFIGLRGSASVASISIAGLVGLGLSDVTRGGTHYTLNTAACVGASASSDWDSGQGEDGDSSTRDDFQFSDSPSNPQSSNLQYNDWGLGMNLQSVGGVRSITYNNTCVSFAGNALVNGQTGYAFTFTACDLSALGTGIGNFTIAITGPPGFLYQKSAALTSGYVHLGQH